MVVFTIETRSEIGILRIGSMSGGLGPRIATQMDRLLPGTASMLLFTKPMLTAFIKFRIVNILSIFISLS